MTDPFPVQSILDLHVKYEDSDHCTVEGDPWPCPTVTLSGKVLGITSSASRTWRRSSITLSPKSGGT